MDKENVLDRSQIKRDKDGEMFTTTTTEHQFINQETKELKMITITAPTVLDPELIPVCGCLIKGGSHSDCTPDKTPVTERKRRILSQVFTTEAYLREHRIPELIRFIFAKVMCNKPKRVLKYIIDLLDECMYFRAGYGKPPVLFEERHLKAVIKSFDPGDRGWLTAGQVRRAFTTLGLTPKRDLEVRTPTSKALKLLRDTQERELFTLLSAGCEEEYFL